MHHDEKDNLSMKDILQAKEEVQVNVDTEEMVKLRVRHAKNQKMLEEVLSDKERSLFYLYKE